VNKIYFIYLFLKSSIVGQGLKITLSGRSRCFSGKIRLQANCERYTYFSTAKSSFADRSLRVEV